VKLKSACKYLYALLRKRSAGCGTTTGKNKKHLFVRKCCGLLGFPGVYCRQDVDIATAKTRSLLQTSTPLSPHMKGKCFLVFLMGLEKVKHRVGCYCLLGCDSMYSKRGTNIPTFWRNLPPSSGQNMHAAQSSKTLLLLGTHNCGHSCISGEKQVGRVAVPACLCSPSITMNI
jgi:hypothetical protein